MRLSTHSILIQCSGRPMQKLDIFPPGLILRRRRHAAITRQLNTFELRSVDPKIELWILWCGSWAFPSHKTPSRRFQDASGTFPGTVLGAASSVSTNGIHGFHRIRRRSMKLQGILLEFHRFKDSIECHALHGSYGEPVNSIGITLFP